ncbi:hypothetical protein HA402_009497 [Bradysia odoriphaga]|nr:hypothetical protein HA402_009497 [Bradysia odoriphaga]
MFNHFNKLDENTVRVRNGHSVMNAIASQNNQITEDELLDQFITSTDAPRDLIEDELKEILHNGVVGGFIVKTGNVYAIPTFENTYAADCDDSEGDESKDDEREGDEKEYAITISSPDRADVTVKVEPGSTRKRAATGPSPHEHCPKKGRDEPEIELCPEAAALWIKIKSASYGEENPRLRMDIFKPSMSSIAELSEPCAPDIVKEKKESESEEEAEEEEEEDESGHGFEGERRDDDDDEDPSACVTGPATRKSTRIIIAAKGKCGGRSDPHKCSF